MNEILRELHVGLPDGIRTPYTDRALREAADIIRDQWMVEAGAHVETGEYLESIRRAHDHPFDGDSESESVGVFSSSLYSEYLEWGHAGFQLSRRISHWRMGRNGPYQIVPFRHDVPPQGGEGRTPAARGRAMPRDIYSQAKRLPLGGHLGSFGNRGRQYKDYDAMRVQYGPQDWIPKTAGYQWRNSPYDRMYRYDSTPTPRGGRHTRYTTFRTIKPDSDGWVIPPHPGYHFAQNALTAATPVIQRLLEEAAIRDMRFAIEDALDWMRS